MVSLLEVTVSLLCISFAGLHVLDNLLAISPRNPAGAAAALLALPTAYFTAMILVYIQTALAPPAPAVSPSALRLLAAMACVLLLLVAIIMPLAPWLLSI